MKNTLKLTSVATAFALSIISLGSQAAELKDVGNGIPGVPTDPDFVITNMNGETEAQGQYGTQVYGDLLNGLKKGQTGVVYSQWKNDGGTSPSLLTALQNGQSLSNEGTIWVLGGGDNGNYAEGMGNFYNVTATLTNKGTIYVKTTEWFEGTKAMGANPGATIVNEGTIVVEGGVGMYANSGANGGMVNKGTIEVNESAAENVVSVGMSWNKTNATLTEFKNDADGRILVDGKRAFGVWAEEIKPDSTFENAGEIVATNGATAITATQASGFTLALTGNSHIVGAVALHDSANITATDLASTTTETLELTNNKLNSLSLKDSSLGFTGEGALNITSVNFNGDKGSTLALKDSRSLKADTVNGTGFLNLASKETTVTIGTLNGNVEAGFETLTADDFANSEELSKMVQADNIEEDSQLTTYVGEGNIKGAMTVKQDANGTTSSTADNTKLESFKGVNASALVQWRNQINHLTKRLGDVRHQSGDIGAWARVYGGEYEWGDANRVDMQTTTVQVGGDARLGDWIVGGAFSYSDSSYDLENGDGDGDLYSLAVYGTRTFEKGSYVDFVARYGYIKNDIQAGNMDVDFGSNAFSLSVEGGHTFKLMERAYVEPQIEVTYGFAQGDDATASNGVKIEQDDYQNLITRIGFRTGFDFPNEAGTIYAHASYSYDFLGEADGTASQNGLRASLDEDLGGGWVTYGIGGQFRLGESTFAYGELERSTGGDVDNPWAFNVGLRHLF